MWRDAGIAIDFFGRLPLNAMNNRNDLVGNTNAAHDQPSCLAQDGERYVVFLPNGGRATLDLTGIEGDFELTWLNPRVGGAMLTTGEITGGGSVQLPAPPEDPRDGAGAAEDWALMLTRKAD